MDAGGNAYVTGETTSDAATFPEIGGPDLSFNGGVTDAFVAKVNPTGSALVYAGYIGGGGMDAGRGIAVDASGNAYVTGQTDSTEGTFPVTGGPDLSFNVSTDAFVAKVNPTGSALLYAGYIGGSGDDIGRGIAVDAIGNAYVIGQTSSSEASFPETVGPDLTYNFGTDAFVAKIASGPAAPASLTATAISSSSIILGWLDNSNNETNFRTERKLGLCTSANPWVPIATVLANVITFTNTALSANTAYSYRVMAYNTFGNSGYSNCASATTGLAGTPNSTSGLTATSVAAGQINLAWADNSTNETGFRIFRRIGTGTWTLLFTTAANAVSYPDTTALGNTSTTTYSYYMRACNGAGCSPTTTVAVVPYRPTALAATVSPGQINLTWTDTSANETGFQIVRKWGNCASMNSWITLATKAANSASHSDRGLTSGTTYAYRIRSFTRSIAMPYAHGYSLWSTCVSAATP